MAYYLVTAKPKPECLGDLRANLRRHAYASMRPFGQALTFSLENARMREDGYATWEEEDYCSPPLAQERAAALDEFFDELDVARVQEGTGWEKIEGFPRLFPEFGSKPIERGLSPGVTATEMPHEPGKWPRLFEQYFNAGNLDAVTALYEPDARFVAQSGETVVGSGRIRKVLAGLIEAKTHFQSRVLKAVTIDNIALLYTDFEGTTVDHSGIRSQSVTRRLKCSAASPAVSGS